MSLLVKPVTISAVSIIASFRRNELSRTQRKACPKWDSPDTNGVPIDYPKQPKFPRLQSSTWAERNRAKKLAATSVAFRIVINFGCISLSDIAITFLMFFENFFYFISSSVSVDTLWQAHIRRPTIIVKYISISTFLPNLLDRLMLRITSYSFGNNVHRASTIANLKERQR